MVAPSKLFRHPLNSCHCSQIILHPGIGCLRFFINNLFIHGIHGSKYFLPLLITPLLLKYKSMTPDLFLHIVKHYLQTVLGGSLATASVFLFICCLRNFIGKFLVYTTLFLPAVLGLQFCWLFPKRVLKLFTTATSQATLEGMLQQYSNKFTHLILHSPLVQTILFMLNSALILHYKRKNIYKDFWFIEPHEKFYEARNENKNLNSAVGKCCEKYKTHCDHTNVSCQKFLLDGMISHVLCGLPLDLLSMLMNGDLRPESQSILRKIVAKLRTFRPHMTCFFICYVGIYRLSSCVLRKYCNNLSLDMQHMLAAFLGGVSFSFVKRISFISLSIIISAQLLWQQFCRSTKKPESGRNSNLILILLQNAPISQIIFSICGGYLVHNYILNIHLVNALARGFLDGITHDKPKKMRHAIINNSLQSLIEMKENYSVKLFL